MKLALVVEGGAMRGIFSAGVLDAFIKADYNPFDFCIGVSAGANNITSFLAGMYQRSYEVYTKYNVRKEFISWKKYLKGGHLLDLDWLWETTIKEIPMDKKRIFASKCEFFVGVTEVETGKIKYIKPKENNIETVLKASCCIPGFYRQFIKIEDGLYADGGIADPIPVKEAVNHGAQMIIVLRSRPYSYNMKQKRYFLSHIILRKYPHLSQSIRNRYEYYQNTIEFMRNQKEIKIIEVNPPEDFKTKHLTKNLDILNSDYQSGYHRGVDLVKEIKSYITV